LCGDTTTTSYQRETVNMTEREQTIVCAFDQRSPRVSAFDIHEWIYEIVHLQEYEVVMVQIDGLRRHVYINFREPQRM
jgi:hypothetical protein